MSRVTSPRVWPGPQAVAWCFLILGSRLPLGRVHRCHAVYAVTYGPQLLAFRSIIDYSCVCIDDVIYTLQEVRARRGPACAKYAQFPS